MKRILPIILAILLFSSCEEVVVLDLKSNSEKLVIESFVQSSPGLVKVSLTKSLDFYDPQIPERITDAKVFFITKDGYRIELNSNKNGKFVARNLVLSTNEAYTIEIEYGDEVISATTTLPPEVPVKSITPVPHPFFGPDSISLVVEFNDPAGIDNFYRLKIHGPGMDSPNDYYLIDDSFGPGGVITSPVYYKYFAAGDTAIVRLISMDKGTYTYLSGLVDNMNGSFNSIAPGNPVSNLPEGYLGYFGGYTIVYDTLIVPPLVGF